MCQFSLWNYCVSHSILSSSELSPALIQGDGCQRICGFVLRPPELLGFFFFAVVWIAIFFFTILLSNFSSHEYILSGVVITVVFQWWFSSSLIPSLCINWISLFYWCVLTRFYFSVQEICVLSYSFTRSFMYVWTCRYIFCSLGYGLIFSLLCCSHCPSFGPWELCQTGFSAFSARCALGFS